jgi:hypothetical protein
LICRHLGMVCNRRSRPWNRYPTIRHGRHTGTTRFPQKNNTASILHEATFRKCWSVIPGSQWWDRCLFEDIQKVHITKCRTPHSWRRSTLDVPKLGRSSEITGLWLSDHCLMSWCVLCTASWLLNDAANRAGSS